MKGKKCCWEFASVPALTSWIDNGLSRLFECLLWQDPLQNNCSCVSGGFPSPFFFIPPLLPPPFLPSLFLCVHKICMQRTGFRLKRRTSIIIKPKRTQTILSPLLSLNSNWKEVSSCELPWSLASHTVYPLPWLAHAARKKRRQLLRSEL